MERVVVAVRAGEDDDADPDHRPASPVALEAPASGSTCERLDQRIAEQLAGQPLDDRPGGVLRRPPRRSARPAGRPARRSRRRAPRWRQALLDGPALGIEDARLRGDIDGIAKRNGSSGDHVLIQVALEGRPGDPLEGLDVALAGAGHDRPRAALVRAASCSRAGSRDSRARTACRSWPGLGLAA